MSRILPLIPSAPLKFEMVGLKKVFVEGQVTLEFQIEVSE
jgi:hypothetical protein